MSTCGGTICYYWANSSDCFLLVLCHNAHSGTSWQNTSFLLFTLLICGFPGIKIDWSSSGNWSEARLRVENPSPSLPQPHIAPSPSLTQQYAYPFPGSLSPFPGSGYDTGGMEAERTCTQGLTKKRWYVYPVQEHRQHESILRLWWNLSIFISTSSPVYESFVHKFLHVTSWNHSSLWCNRIS